MPKKTTKKVVKKSYDKNLLILILVGVVAAVCILGLIKKNSEMQYGNNKLASFVKTTAYVDKNFKYSIGLPEGWTVDQTIDGGKKFTKDEMGLTVQVVGKNNTPYKNLGEVRAKNQELIADKVKNNIEISFFKNTRVDNYSGMQQLEDYTKISNNNQSCAIATYFEKDSEVHRIALTSNNCKSLIDYRQKLDAIVKSFKYIK